MENIGKVFGELTIVSKFQKENQSGRKKSYYTCLCSCGIKKDILRGNVVNGHTKSCGHLSVLTAKKNNSTHKLSKHRLYSVHQGMKGRCYRETEHDYFRYGGRGITICDEWLNKETGFTNFYEWATTNGYKPGLTIDRINNDGNYEPSNCRWATQTEQVNNIRTNVILEIDDKVDTASRIAKDYGVDAHKVLARIRRGWSAEEAVFLPNYGVKYQSNFPDISHTHEYKGGLMTLKEIVDMSGTLIPLYIVSDRLRKGWEMERALTQPVRKSSKRVRKKKS